MENVEHIDSVRGAEETAFEMPRKANEVMLEAIGRRPQPALVDGFWQSGEVALLFGAAGIGKSLLAVQVAEALARGRPIDGFVMPRRQRRRVLYVDLTLSDVQFQRASRRGRRSMLVGEQDGPRRRF
jgi:RecA-family ATPase